MPEKNVQVNTDRGLPYERFLQFGPENLTEAELLAVILRTGTKEDSAVALAEKVLALATYPREGLLGLHDVSVEELMEIRGIGMVKAVKLKCIAELSNRMSRAKAREGICFTRADHVAEYFMEKLRHRDTECVYLLCLDAKGQLIREKKLSDGQRQYGTDLSQRDIFGGVKGQGSQSYPRAQSSQRRSHSQQIRQGADGKCGKGGKPDGHSAVRLHYYWR